MDKNSVIGLVLIGVILVTFSILNAPTEAERQRAQQQRDSINQVRADEAKILSEQVVENQEKEEVAPANAIDSIDVMSNDSLIDAENNDIYGVFAQAVEGEDTYTTIENDVIKVTVANKGGRIVSVELKEYQTYDSSALYLFDEEHSRFNLNYFTKENKDISTEELYFEPQDQSFKITGGDTKSFSTRLYTNNKERYLEYRYTLTGDSYLMEFDVEMVGLDKIIATNSEEMGLLWKIDAPSLEKDIESQQRTTTVHYMFKNGDTDYINEMKDEQEDLVASVKWVAFKQQYFTAAIIADEFFDKSNSDIETKTIENSNQYTKTLTTHLSIPFEHRSSQHFDMAFYFGPNHYQTLEEMDLGLETLIPLGWGIFGWVNEWVVIPIFNWLDHFNLGYGIIILLLTLIIKMCLFPITYKTYLSSAKMKVLKPEITEINEKYKDDAMKKQQATMSLYKQTGVNPFSGCIPMLIQFPILLAMFRFFPASIELRQESFLWADDLSTYDSILDLPFSIPFYGDHVSLFTLLMAISMIFYTRMNGSMGMSGGAAGGMQATQMKIMMYLMPVMMLFFFNSYSAGLSYYYLVANLVSMGQQFAIKNWIVNDEAILKKIEQNRKKPKTQKKSAFQKRLEEMAKQRGYQQPKK